MTQILVKEINDQDLKESITSGGGTMIVLFGRHQDPHCLAMRVMVDELAAEFPNINFNKFNISDNNVAASQLGLLVFPSLVVFNGGKAVKKISGPKSRYALSKELAPWLGG
jgi:thioredoxin 1